MINIIDVRYKGQLELALCPLPFSFTLYLSTVILIQRSFPNVTQEMVRAACSAKTVTTRE